MPSPDPSSLLDRLARRRHEVLAAPPRVAILGAGIGGLAMGIGLRRAGIDSFTIFEKSDGVGGTWRDNTYPGAECDVPSHLYSFSFAPRTEWTKRFAGQAEILAYLEECADRFELRPHLRTRCAITEARWDDDAHLWRLTTEHGEAVEADVVVSGLGQLNQPLVPDFPGLDEFSGPVFHSARWRHDVELAGRHVAVVGNAASAVQLVPKVAEAAAHLDVYQRSPNWVAPRRDHVYSERAKELLTIVPGLERAYRALIFWSLEARFLAFHQGSRLGRFMEDGLRRYLDAAVRDTELRAALTPEYPVGCKRILLQSDYYSTLQRDDVDLVTSPIEQVTADGIVTADGVHHPADVLVLATGFDTTHFLAPVQVTGRDGAKLDDVWAGGAEAYRGVAVHGFPNLFLLYGPNTNLGHNSIIFMIEQQVRYVLGCIHRLRETGAGALDVHAEAMRDWNEYVQSRLEHTVWASGCASWYKTASGRITNNWSGYASQYWLALRVPRFSDFEVLPVGVPTG